MVSGDNLNIVYRQACQVAGNEAHSGTLIVHLDLPSDTAILLLMGYHIPVENPDGQRQAWLNELVSRWQKDSYLRGDIVQMAPVHADEMDRPIARDRGTCAKCVV